MTQTQTVGATVSKLSSLLQDREDEILSDWLKEMSGSVRRRDLISDSNLKDQAKELLRAITAASQNGNTTDLGNPTWDGVKELLTSISSSRAKQGFTPSETATFVLSLKRPVFKQQKKELGKDPEAVMTEIESSGTLLDKLGLFTTEAFTKVREQIILRQQEEMLELSTPVVRLWEGVLVLPIIGTLDSARTQVVMESLLKTVVETNSRIAIIDITGVPTVDTLVAQHLLKTITAARLMGAECIISGIRPQIAQTIVHLGIDLTEIITKAKLSDAFAVALQRTGRTIVRSKNNGNTANGSKPTEISKQVA
jgi:rsbT co-antagonist protein RsbR